jgi:threonine/homoserine/homoserine lactone efflux protein
MPCMFSFIKIFFTGLLISFLGSLPLGTLNIAAMQIAIAENNRNAIKFAVGVAIVEILYVRVSLTGVNWVVQHKKMFYVLEWLTVVLFVVLSISSFIAARKKEGDQKNVLLKNNINRFMLGLGMSAINPVQIPFWFLWSTYLISNGILNTANTSYNIYIAGIGTGTLVGLAIFIFAGKYIVKKIGSGAKALNIFVGIVFLVSAGVQCYRVITKPLHKQLKQQPVKK